MHQTADKRENDGPKHLAYIDALRGCAFLAVVAVHIPPHVPTPRIIERVLTSCNYGVQLFYVISALTLLMSFEARSSKDRHPIRAFYLRRFFRIAPLFWFALVFYSLHLGLGPRKSAPYGIGIEHLLTTFFFAHGWYPTTINSVVPGGWSIAVEMNFYLLFPLCYRLMHGLKRSVVIAALMLPLTVGVSVVAKHFLDGTLPPEHSHLLTSFTYFWLPRQFAVFCLGFVLFEMLKRRDAAENHASAPPSRSPLPVFGALALLAILSFLGDRVPLAYYTTSIAFGLLAYGLSQTPLRLFVNPLTVYIGKISYSGYLVHPFVIALIAKYLVPSQTAWGQTVAGFPICYVLAVAGTAAIASVTHRLIEEPAQNLGRSVIKRLGYARAPRTETPSIAT